MNHSILKVRLVGVAPLLMRSGQMADPLNPVVRELERYTSRRKKVDADHLKIADLEFAGSLWLQDGRPCLLAGALEAAICQSAARRRAKALFRGAVMVMGNSPLLYDGPQTVAGLQADSAFRLRMPVAIGGRRLIRTRPMFRTWSAIVECGYLASLVNRADLIDVLIAAGDTIGVGDHRPRFGRFAVAPLDEPQLTHD
ncbi:hypothetical protein [Beijerinckia sp. L45]|uniref:hypothetical protein n=1 Tax=Beijerinckia sp. L45 TaxID=1641855 RepID=UPI00131B9280|nr:hypothetical protein [Beijerinckia sp. L45]